MHEEKLHDKVSEYLRDGGKLRRAINSTITDKRTTSPATLLGGGDQQLQRLWMARLSSARLLDPLRDVICNKLDWCRHRKNKTIAWIVKVVQAVIIYLEGWSGSVANIVGMILSGFFDLLCDCTP